MRTTSRASLLAVLATVLSLGVPALATASPAAADSSSASRAARSILDQVTAAFSSKTSAARSSAPATSGREATLLLRDLRNALPSLTGAERRTANGFLARPTDPGSILNPGGDPAFCDGCQPTVLSNAVTRNTAHFLIHYRPTSAGANRNNATYTQVLATAAQLERVYSYETGHLGFRKPLSDIATSSSGDAGNPNGKMDVYLADTGIDGIYGYVSSDVGGSTRAPYMVLDNDFASSQFGAPPLESLKVTAAHEFFHAIQYAYDANEARWFSEGSAVWMEDQVFSNIDDYLQYLPDSQIGRPGLSLNLDSDVTWYGAVTFWKYLSERFKSPGILRQIWTNAAVSVGSRSARQAVEYVLKQRNASFATEFGRYAMWNTLPPGTYADRKLFPAVGIWGQGTLTKGARDTGTQTIRINHMATAPVVLRPGGNLRSASKVKLTVNGPAKSHGTQAWVQIRMKSGSVTKYHLALNNSGDVVKTFGFSPSKVRSMVLTLTNSSGGYDSQVFKFRATVKY